MPKAQEQIACQETQARDLEVLKLECEEEQVSPLARALPSHFDTGESSSLSFCKATLGPICYSSSAHWVAVTPGWSGRNQLLPKEKKAAQVHGATLLIPQATWLWPVNTVAGGRATSCMPRENLL